METSDELQKWCDKGARDEGEDCGLCKYNDLEHFKEEDKTAFRNVLTNALRDECERNRLETPVLYYYDEFL